MITIDVSDEILDLLKRSRLSDREASDQVRIALAIHLLQEGLLSIGKAAEISGEPRVTFELLLADMGIPASTYGIDDYQQDRDALQRARQQ